MGQFENISAYEILSLRFQDTIRIIKRKITGFNDDIAEREKRVKDVMGRITHLYNIVTGEIQPDSIIKCYGDYEEELEEKRIRLRSEIAEWGRLIDQRDILQSIKDDIERLERGELGKLHPFASGESERGDAIYNS